MGEYQGTIADILARPPVQISLNLMIDGLYIVTTSYLCAGFVVREGRVTICAPILRKRFEYWKTVARRVEC